MTLGVVAVVLATLLGFAALAVDVANGYVARAILQHAVDDGALTAQRWSAQVDDPGADPSAVQNQAVAEALETARRDIEAQGLAGATAVEAAVAGSHLRIAARATIRTWFLRPLGIATLAPSASADTVLRMAIPSSGPPAGEAAEHRGEAPAGPRSGDFPGADGPPGGAGGDIMEGP